MCSQDPAKRRHRSNCATIKKINETGFYKSQSPIKCNFNTFWVKKERVNRTASHRWLGGTDAVCGEVNPSGHVFFGKELLYRGQSQPLD